jgi:endoglucanase
MKKIGLLLCITNICLAQIKIKIDQFGYLPNAQKIAIISRPVLGYNGGSTFTPGIGANVYKVKDANTNAVVFSGTISAWNAGATDAISGDKTWWFDFSAVTTPGNYYIFDATTSEQSHTFTIDTIVYSAILQTCQKMYYYQRCGVEKFATFAGAPYSDAACHIGGNNQDAQCRLYSSPNDVSTNKDLSGGWHDAGDYSKYVNFTQEAINDLLLAYKENPDVWNDATGIPESGNGIPDILDHIKIETDWLLKMQQTNGSVLCIVGTQNFANASPPSADAAQRVYGPATTSASFTTAVVLAQASHIMAAIPALNSYSATLQTAAINAYNWAVSNPNITFYNSGGTIAAGENELGSTYEINARQFDANVYLYACTGLAAYKNYIDANYASIHAMQWYYWYQFELGHQDALLYYAKLSGTYLPTATVAADIIANYTTSITANNPESLPGFINKSSSYNAYMHANNYTWNSHNFIAHNAIMMYDAITYNINAANHTNYRNAANAYLSYYHGVNPLDNTYLTNTTSLGADHCITEIYHAWFTDGSVWDKTGTSLYGPPAGYLTGGVNPSYTLDDCCNTNSCGTAGNTLCNAASVTPPIGQPPLKSYKDFNTDWPQNSFKITEIGIYTQAAYLRLLSKFATPISTLPLAIAPTDLYLHGQIINNAILLKWNDKSLENYANIVLQKSNDGISFENVLVINNTTNTFIDKQTSLFQKYYYRLQGVQNSQIVYSNMASFSMMPSIEIYPNPVKNVLCSNGINCKKIIITNTSGATIMVFTDAQKQQFANGINVENLPTGLYFITMIQADGGQMVKRFWKE